MIVTREWIVACKCPDCGLLMEELSHLQEQHYPKDTNMPEMWTISSGFTQGTAPFTCKECGKTHETKDLTPEMIAMQPGTGIPLAAVVLSQRGRLHHEARLVTWKYIVDSLSTRDQAPLIGKILEQIRPFEDDEAMIPMFLTLDEQIACTRALETTEIPK